ncbi:AAA domain-containing protein, putative AbiEii toxin, Type IV TA system [Tardiphaga sp. OK246]|uniref:AAA family ATPase n=1 Tax=Tardiphaga sp. OK246 TaxID=1855307 RepID=UPI000B69B6AA|nr:AAA family ATPase [Tardiphaga sp. OK246]SNT61654.1 AAA domain-containing protein, putative AbiEii toxin, Type IV TA system [Tardiphaga sp. OK246]
MRFRLVSQGSAASSGNEVLLIPDNWNDWFVWVTQFYAVVVYPDGTRVDIGQVKIASAGMTPNSGKTLLPPDFPALGEEYFSIGQAENYYETLNELGPGYRKWFLAALRDCASDLTILSKNEQEPVLQQSLLRDINSDRVRDRLHRLANGDAALSEYAFRYVFPQSTEDVEPALVLPFEVIPNSLPPTNVHVLIGRNGVGKSRCFDLLSRTFLSLQSPEGAPAGELQSININPFTSSPGAHGFAGLVTVSFSAFDQYGPLTITKSDSKVRYSYIGLLKDIATEAPSTTQSSMVKTRAELTEDFVYSVGTCRVGARRERWASALRKLEADPLFEEANVSAIADEKIENWADLARRTFARMSSGHAVVLLTVTRLVELVEERSLVLIDEPEGHLHPPLLSAFVRALSALLINRNGVAIIATHSPVVLQEVPKDCVWILNRSGRQTRADRPELETFGENVGILTREVFSLEVVQTGFHQMISDAVHGASYEQVLQKFHHKLGAEARALARALTLISKDEAGSGEGDE